ncbi:MAG TPA: hypothetical protein VJA85_00450 [Candidatus Limnocylindria bacterium]|nr:hypothetical protein [Candidatus Limnocylindria bacterium]
MNWFPLLLVLHIGLAIALLAPSLVLPFLLRSGAPSRPGAGFRVLLQLQGGGSLVIGLGLAITGVGLIVSLGTQLLSQPWLLVALALYAVNLLIAGLISRPNLRALLRIGGTDDAEAWRARARRQRWLAYALAGVTGVIGLLMNAKPDLW